MRIGRFILSLFVSLLVVAAVGIIFERLDIHFNWYPGYEIITGEDGGQVVKPVDYFLFYPIIAATGAFLGSLITWLLVAPRSPREKAEHAKPAKAVKGKQTRRGKLTGKSETAADLSGMPSFDFDKAQKDIKESSQKGREESKQ